MDKSAFDPLKERPDLLLDIISSKAESADESGDDDDE